MSSEEFKAVGTEIERICVGMGGKKVDTSTHAELTEVAMLLYHQVAQTTSRVFQQYWRTLTYIWGKISLVLGSAL